MSGQARNLTLATAAFYAFLRNWHCYARPILGRRFLVLTDDVRGGGDGGRSRPANHCTAPG